MSRRFSKVSSIILLVLFAFFFASTNLFFHTHEGLSGKIVHSHPWSAKSHNHTSAQFQAISILSANVFDLSDTMELSDCPQRPLIAEQAEHENNSGTPVENTYFNKQAFLAIDPFIGSDYIVSEAFHLTLKADWLN